ncbi:MAG: XRE family transcriptional regulator [Chitinophagaceae bacterium]|nr:MAG: XRE family transcriptional regulator [Chitinophagaceae bacterium]
MIGTSGPIVGRYERSDMTPSIEIATKISEALEVSLGSLVGKSSLLVKIKINWSGWKMSQSYPLKNKRNCSMSWTLTCAIIKPAKPIIENKKSR